MKCLSGHRHPGLVRLAALINTDDEIVLKAKVCLSSHEAFGAIEPNTSSSSNGASCHAKIDAYARLYYILLCIFSDISPDVLHRPRHYRVLHSWQVRASGTQGRVPPSASFVSHSDDRLLGGVGSLAVAASSPFATQALQSLLSIS